MGKQLSYKHGMLKPSESLTVMGIDVFPLLVLVTSGIMAGQRLKAGNSTRRRSGLELSGGVSAQEGLPVEGNPVAVGGLRQLPSNPSCALTPTLSTLPSRTRFTTTFVLPFLLQPELYYIV